MAPTHQGLEADGARGPQVHDRLVDELELVAVHRVPQFVHHGQSLAQRRLHLGLEDPEDAAAARLGAVKRHVGLAQ